MYPLLDSTTMNARAAEGRRAAAAARLARDLRGRDEKEEAHPHGVRHAVGVGLVRIGHRLIHA